MKIWLYIILIFFSSCVSYNVDITKKEYKESKEGFWKLKSDKAIQKARIVKTKNNRRMNKLRRENERIQKENAKQRQKYKTNSNYLKTFDHH